MSKRNVRFFLLGLTLILLSGCGTKSLPPLKSFYLTSSDDCCTKVFKPKPYTIQIVEPITNKYLNSTSIFYSEKQYEIEAYQLSKWSDYPTKMLHEVILSTMDELNIYENVLTDNIYAKSDFILQSELFDLKQIIQNNKSHIVLKIKFYLIDKKDPKNVVSQTFNYKIDTDEINAYAAVEAVNKAVDLLLNDLSLWLSKQ